jgi:CBS domain-containing protein
MNVASILKGKGTKIITARETDSVAEISRILGENRIGAVLITGDEDKVLGVLSERDIVRGLSNSAEGCLKLPARDLMTRNVISCSPSDTIDDVMSLMTAKRIRHLPVLGENGALAGFISIGDVVKLRMDEVEREAAAMRDYIATG